MERFLHSVHLTSGKENGIAVISPSTAADDRTWRASAHKAEWLRQLAVVCSETSYNSTERRTPSVTKDGESLAWQNVPLKGFTNLLTAFCSCRPKGSQPRQWQIKGHRGLIFLVHTTQIVSTIRYLYGSTITHCGSFPWTKRLEQKYIDANDTWDIYEMFDLILIST